MLKAKVTATYEATFLLPLLFALLALSSCSAPEPLTRQTRIFASPISLTLYPGFLGQDRAGRIIEACFARLRELDSELTMWDPDSALSRLNAKSGAGPVRVSADLLAVAGRGLELAKLSDGIFDPTVAPLVKLWGVGTDRARVPTEAELREARALIGWRRARIDEAAATIELGVGMGLDFGALAKGYGAEEAGKLLVSRGVKTALLEVGGCVLALGSGPGGRPWRVGIQEPGENHGAPLGYLSLRDSAVDTSGVYESWFESEGHRYAHIMDTRTGRPVEGPLVSATVATPMKENADGPPLALLVLGPEAGLALAERLGLAAVLVSSDHRIFLSKAAAPLFTLTDQRYAITK